MRTGARLWGSSVPLSLTWSTAVDAGLGLATTPYELERSNNAGTWTSVGTYAGTNASVTAATSGTVRYRVRAVDKLGNVVLGIHRHAVAPPQAAIQRCRQVRRDLTKASSTSYSGSSTKYAKVRGRSASYQFTGRSIALVTTKAPSKGKAKIYVNGVYQGAIDLYRSSTQHRTVAWQKTWSTGGHTDDQGRRCRYQRTAAWTSMRSSS